jgi:hypothetical protein
MSKTKQLLDDMHSMEFYSVYADSDYWYNEWEKVNRDNGYYEEGLKILAILNMEKSRLSLYEKKAI